MRVKHYTPRIEHEGKACPWCVEEVEFAEDGKTLLRIKERRGFESEAEAMAAFKQWEPAWRKQKAKSHAAQDAADKRKPSIDEEDLAKARLIVMREQYPDTFKALDALAQARPEARPGAAEAVFRAYAVDVARLHKPANLGELTPFETLPADRGFILELAKAYTAQSPHDPVDFEIAAQWFAAGYDKMSLADYTRAINAKTGASVKPDAMEKRRYQKLGLMTKKPTGPAPKS